MDADGVEQLLSQQFSQFLCPVDSVNEYDQLVEGQSVKEMSKFLKLLILNGFGRTSLM